MKKLHYQDMYKNDKYVRQRFSKYFNLVKKDLYENINILDIGGYIGDFLKKTKEEKIKFNINYYVLDQDKNALKIAKSRGAQTIYTDFNKDKINTKVKNKFNIILACEVLEHLVDPLKTLLEIKKIAKKNTIIIISLPNENTIFHRIYSLIGLGIDQCAFEKYKHLHLPTISQNRKFVSNFFNIEREIYYINPSGKGSRLSIFSKILNLFPDFFWQFLANTFPGLFARGVIFKLKIK